MTDEMQLKHCPYCGAPAEMYVIKHIPKGNDYTPRCTNPSCCGRISKKWTSKEAATNAWNMRKGS